MSAGDRITWTDMRESSKGLVDVRKWARAVRRPGRSLKEMVGDGPVFPLLILFGLNAVDELDRTGFGILLPNIRDAFGMSNTGILTLVGVTALGALLMQMPIAIACSTGNGHASSCFMNAATSRTAASPTPTTRGLSARYTSS